MDKLWFQMITITQIQHINVQQILVITFEFTGAARRFMISLYFVRPAGLKRLDSTALGRLS